MSERRVIGPYTAYTIAVAHGYTGTEAEWVAEQEKLRNEAAASATAAAASAAEAEATKNTAVTQINAAGTAQISAVNTAGSTQVINVNNAGATQVTAIENKGAETLESIPDDYTTLGNTVSQLSGEIVERAPGIEVTATGEEITLTDAANAPIRELTVYGKSTQDGDPTPDSPVEIVSAESPTVIMTGKNLLPYPYSDTTKTSNGITFTDNGDGSITVSGTATGSANFYLFRASVAGETATEALRALMLNNIITIGGCPSGGSTSTYRMRLTVYNGTNTANDIGSGNSVTFTNGSTAFSLVITVESGTTMDSLVFWPQIELGSAKTDWEAYSGGLATLDYTLRSVGNYADELTVKADGTGVLTKRVAKIDFSTVSKQVYKSGDVWRQRFTWAAIKTSQYTKALACSHFPTRSGSYVTGYMNNVSWNTFNVEFSLPTITSEAELLTWMDEQEAAGTPFEVIAYQTPVTTDLTAAEVAAVLALNTVKPTTVITNDAGAEMSVTYIADTKTYIDNKITEVCTALLNS